MFAHDLSQSRVILRMAVCLATFALLAVPVGGSARAELIDGLLHYFPFDDGSGTTAANLVNTAYRGTLVDPGGCYGDVCQEMTCRSTLSVSAIFNPR